MKNIIFIAPPAAGKGTQAKLLSNKYSIPHISTGELLREESNKTTELGRKIKEIISSGKFVNDEIITSLLKLRLMREDCNNGYILDGYPRNIEQAHIYEDLLKSINKDLGIVIFFDIDKDLAMERTLSRIACPHCGTSYNLLVNELKPKLEGICDKCNSSLEIRSDDTPESFITRFDTYINKTQSLIDYYKEKNVLREIKVEKDLSAQDIFSKVEEIVNND